MPIYIEKFRINRLWNQYDVEFEIRDNVLVVVGENGTGKSTILEIFYYFISGRYRNLLDYDFYSLEMVVGGEEYKIEYGDIHESRNAYTPEQEKIYSNFGTRYREIFENYYPEELLKDRDLLRSVAFSNRMPISRLKDVLDRFVYAGLTSRSPSLLDKKVNVAPPIDFIPKFLPTYRRIERSLDSLIRISKGRDVGNVKEELGAHTLVNFGMSDVEKMLNKVTSSLESDFRHKLSFLTASFFKDAIRENFTATKQSLKKYNYELIDATLQRVDERILSSGDKYKLKSDIKKMKTKSRLYLADRVKLQFFDGIHKAYSEQIKNEKKVLDYISLCNKYLVEKRMVFDSDDFTIGIVTEAGKNLEFEHLSSGEKQVISLFSKFYFYDQKFAIFIDEPELSLSVKWQEYFLEDILNMNDCAGVFAVTHSPFIFDNSLSSYVVSARECMRLVKDA